MDYDRYQQDLRALRAGNRKLGTAVSILSLGLLLAIVDNFRIRGSERTIITPPTLEKSFWVSHDRVSAEYLEQMAGYFQWLILDASPASLEWKTREVLKWTDPASYAEIKVAMELAGKRLKETNGSTTFAPSQLITNEKDQTVVIVGQLRKRINGVDVGGGEQSAFKAAFSMKHGRVHLASFNEVPHDSLKPGSSKTARTSTAAADDGAAR